jgi:hypothetical protein
MRGGGFFKCDVENCFNGECTLLLLKKKGEINECVCPI